MTPTELLALIDSDSVASALAVAGDDAGCAARCVQIATPVRVPVAADTIKYSAVTSLSWAKIKLARDSAASPVELRMICISFIDWVDSGRTINFDLPLVQGMLARLIAAGLVDQAVADQMIAMQSVPQTITANDVSAAMLPRRPEGKI